MSESDASSTPPSSPTPTSETATASPPKNLLPIGIGIAVLAWLIVLGISLAALFMRPVGAPAGAGGGAPPPSEKVKAMIQEKAETLKLVQQATQVAFQNGFASAEDAMKASMAVSRAQLDLCATKEERLKIYEEMLAECKKSEELIAAREKAGAVTKLESAKAKLIRLELEIEIEKMK